MPEFRELLREACSDWLSLSDAQMALLEGHYEILVRWNEKMNLTAISDPKRIVRKHFGESLFLSSLIGEGRSLADIGSGGGFPGLPIAVLHPEMSVFLVESDRRKAVFLQEASLGLPNVRILGERAERLEIKYDWVVSRGVRYEQLERAGTRIGGRIGLIVKEPPVSGDCVQWNQCVTMPWPDSGYVVIGDVSRGTKMR